MLHGGNIYKKKIAYDFSVNVAPLGVPDVVREAMKNALSMMENYPQYSYENLRGCLAEYLQVKPDEIIPTNGASEAFLAIAHTFKPKVALTVTPSFYGYEYCLNAVKCRQKNYVLKEENEFELEADFLNELTAELDMVILGQPNNPSGKYIEEGLLRKIIERCQALNIILVLDKCFYSLGKEEKPIEHLEKNVIVVNGFTKLCAIAGVRTGFILCQKDLSEEIKGQLPEWNVSVVAEQAAIACTRLIKETDYIENVNEVIKKERQYLSEELKGFGFKVFDSQSNFILFKAKADLAEGLLAKEILIRDCSNFKGLEKGFFRIAVKGHKENEALIKAIGEING